MSTDELRARISERLREAREDAERLQAALDVLEAPAEPDTRTQGRRSLTRARSSQPRRRAAAGETRRAVLSALADGGAMTAGELAAVTGRPRDSISKLLSNLTRAGELVKASRGYALPRGSSVRGNVHNASDPSH
ncbi:MAG: helix-turn-helix domain-containing protein [Solirubrobacteraceae bacterium]